MQESIQGSNLYILGGENIRFLVEEPARMALEGLNVTSFDSDAQFSSQMRQSSPPTNPVCMIASRESLGDNALTWLNEKREKYPWLPIVLLENETSQVSNKENFNFYPQLVESVSVIQYPYTQKAVIDAIETSLWWSQNLCRLLERLRYFASLGERELAIVSMATDGLPNKSMARRLDVSIKTIEKNRRNAYEKLKISSSAEMAALVTFRRYFNRSVAGTDLIAAQNPAGAAAPPAPAPLPSSTHSPNMSNPPNLPSASTMQSME